MREYRFRWHTWVGITILLMYVLTIFVPELSVSGSKYMEAALQANQYAVDNASSEKDKDKNNEDASTEASDTTAKEATEETKAVANNVAADESGEQVSEAQQVLDSYSGENKNRREQVEKQFDDKIGTYSKSWVSRGGLAKFSLRIKDKMDFDGVYVQEGSSLADSGIKGIFRLWGWSIFVPFLFALCTIIFMIIRRRTLPLILICNGILALGCELFAILMIPDLLWKKASTTVEMVRLIGASTLSQEGVGEVFINAVFKNCFSAGPIVCIIFGGILIVYGFLTLIIFDRSKISNSKTESNYDFDYGLESNQKLHVHTETTTSKTQAFGLIQGVKGEYEGQTLQIKSGEEIIFGRDSKHCMMVFGNPKVSRRQCGIRFDAVNGYYMAIDYSSSGTTLSNGTVLTTSEYTPIPPGTIVYMGSGTEAFLLS